MTDCNDIRQEIIKLCNNMTSMWNDLKLKTDIMSNADNADIICEWYNHFESYGETIAHFSLLKERIENVKTDLIQCGMIKQEEI